MSKTYVNCVFPGIKSIKSINPLKLKKGLKCGGEQNVKTIFLLFDSVKIFLCCLHPYTRQNNKIFVQTFRWAAALWKSWVCKYSIRFQIRKLKLLCKILKNEKCEILAYIQTKCGNIAKEILNVAIDAARTFKCKWP